MNNELIDRIDQEIQNLIGQRDVIQRFLPNNTAVRELTQIIKVLLDCKAALSEPVALIGLPMAAKAPHACHCDLEPHMLPEGCVIDEGRINDCVYAKRLTKESKGRDDCEYWQPIIVLDSATPALPQDVEGFIVENELPAFGDDSKVFTFIRTATLRAWMAGHVRVPVLPEKADPLTDNYSSWDVGYNEGWNACRASLLTASKEKGE